MTDFLDPIPGILPFGTLTIFAGAPASGKTTMLVEWIRRWLDGRTICGHATNPPTAFYYVCADRGQSEDAFYTYLGFRDVRVNFYSVVDPASGIDHANFHKPEHGAQLLTHVVTTLDPQPGGHLIIDPFAPLFITGNQNNARSVAASLVGVTRIIKERTINITCSAHFSKQKTNKLDRYLRPEDRISGSGSFSGFSDTQVYIEEPESEKKDYWLLGWRPRYNKAENFKFTRNDQGWFVPYVGLEDVGETRETDRPTHVAELLPEEGLRYNEWERKAKEVLGIPSTTFERDFTKLKERDVIWKDIDGRWHGAKVN